VVEAPAVRHRAQSLGEEIANSISHGTGFLAALIALPVLVIDAVRHGAAAIVGAGVFAATMALLYLTSTLCHALAPNRAKRVFQILDHVAINWLLHFSKTAHSYRYCEQGPKIAASKNYRFRYPLLR
jgi:channel protein (hemolysin III family)